MEIYMVTFGLLSWAWNDINSNIKRANNESKDINYIDAQQIQLEPVHTYDHHVQHY